MSRYDKVYIYFDTNALECRHSGKSLFLSQFVVNNLYYEIEDMIRNMELQDKVQICIPEIVWFELQEHLINHFKSEKASMEAKIVAFRKSFGNLAEVNCEFKGCINETEYATYVKSIAQDFLSSPRVNARIIPCPKDEVTMQQIIDQAVHSVKPFRVAKSGGKEYTDAGFKDALLFNTLLKNTGDQLGIFISNDSDFYELFNENRKGNLKMSSEIKEIQGILASEFNIVSSDMIERILKTDNYLMQRILFECDLDDGAKVYGVEILSCALEEDNAQVNFVADVNDLKLLFSITYSVNANELLEASCEPFEDREDE